MDANMKYRILIVDDSDFSRGNISQMLSDDDRFLIIGEAANAKEAINILRDRKAHLAIVDIVMPEVSGIELAEYISENFQDTAIIMISSLAQESIVIDSISSGAADFLQKPFQKEDLLSSMDKILADVQEEQ